MGWKLKRTRQCKTCPWRVDADVSDIPGNYTIEQHKSLAGTIANPDEFNLRGPLRVMACHHSKPNEHEHCIGWLVNQVGPGNNIGLRVSMRDCENGADVETIGEQHDSFWDTLP